METCTFDVSFTSFVLLFHMCKSEKEAGKMAIPLTSVVERVALLTSVTRGDPEPV